MTMHVDTGSCQKVPDSRGAFRIASEQLWRFARGGPVGNDELFEKDLFYFSSCAVLGRFDVHGSSQQKCTKEFRRAKLSAAEIANNGALFRQGHRCILAQAYNGGFFSVKPTRLKGAVGSEL
jgi:hypothetical protein